MTNESINGIMLTPWGAWGQPWPRSGHRNCAKDWRGAERPQRRATGQALRRNPRKAWFFAEQKMRPDEVLKRLFIFLQEEALYRTPNREAYAIRNHHTRVLRPKQGNLKIPLSYTMRSLCRAGCLWLKNSLLSIFLDSRQKN
jgi:hypothetical protein